MPKTVWARQHQPISLPCGIQSTDSDDYALEWRKDAALIFNAFGNETGHTSLALQGRHASFKSYFSIKTECLFGLEKTNKLNMVDNYIEVDSPLLHFFQTTRNHLIKEAS